jgi:multiple sugar transport system substrate-binding protein
LRILRPAEYENVLLNALAEDKGPDIFSLHNTWVNKYAGKIEPFPDSITVPFSRVEGTIKKEVVTELRTTPGLSIRELKNQFIDIVAEDVVLNTAAVEPEKGNKEKIFALPLAGDSMALFYNKDILNAAGIPEPPAYWDDFQRNVTQLTKQDKQGNIIQSGAAMGTAKNVDRYSDLLSVLMMQNGTVMVKDGEAAFDKMPSDLIGRKNPPGQDAVIFYTDFANPAMSVYTWNDKMPNALQAFTSGLTAFYFGYSYNLPDIRAKAPKLNLGIAKLPQIRDNPEVNFANYWVESVSKKSKNINWAWDFIRFAASSEQADKYLSAAKRPTALRALIKKQTDDIDLSVFASQMLTAKSWYRGKNNVTSEQAMSDLIYSTLNGEDLGRAINNAANRVSETYR